MNRAAHAQLDESLQADVMRFMAIIGFCLIAILALVRNVEPLPVAAQTTEVSAAVPEVVDPSPVPLAPEPAPPIVPTPAKSAPVAVRAEVAPPPMKVAPTPLPRVTKKQPIAQRTPKPPAPSPEPEPEPEPASVPEVAPEQEGLVLRFTSDRDFLTLISARRVQVYAWTDSLAYRLDPGFALHEAEHPGRVFELMAETIPNAIRANLSRLADDADQYSWAVSFPPDIEANLSRLRSEHTAGLLLIDRNGGIEHVANS